jgi:hypothetical protein
MLPFFMQQESYRQNNPESPVQWHTMGKAQVSLMTSDIRADQPGAASNQTSHPYTLRKIEIVV